MLSGDLLLEFWDPLHISGTLEATNFKFGTQIGHWGPNEKMQKSKGVVKRSRDLLLEFLDPLHISGTVEGRNFKFNWYKFDNRRPKRKHAKSGQRGS